MDEENKPIEEKKNVKKEIIEWIKSIAIAVVIAAVIKTFIFNVTYVQGMSMYPTLHEGDRLFSSKISLYFGGPKRNDIVVFDAPDVPDRDYIKRVIGVAGDIVEIKDGKVYVNNAMLPEEYLPDNAYTHVYMDSIWEVPENHLFVLGDNREDGASKDSRYFGCIYVESVSGITNFRYFPFNENFGKLN